MTGTHVVTCVKRRWIGARCASYLVTAAASFELSAAAAGGAGAADASVAEEGVGRRPPDADAADGDSGADGDAGACAAASAGAAVDA